MNNTYQSSENDMEYYPDAADDYSTNPATSPSTAPHSETGQMCPVVPFEERALRQPHWRMLYYTCKLELDSVTPLFISSNSLQYPDDPCPLRDSLLSQGSYSNTKQFTEDTEKPYQDYYNTLSLEPPDHRLANPKYRHKRIKQYQRAMEQANQGLPHDEIEESEEEESDAEESIDYALEEQYLHPTSGVTVRSVVYSYMQSLQWVMAYYYLGCPSWSWFYPHLYPPLLCDLVALDKFPQIVFSMDEPFHPFEQLLAVLPSASAKLLPPSFRPLMFDTPIEYHRSSPDDPSKTIVVREVSPIAHFYPSEFEVDMEFSSTPWEGTCILPFIDVDLLKKVVQSVSVTLTDEEKNRNSHKFEKLFRSPRHPDFTHDFKFIEALEQHGIKLEVSQNNSQNEKHTSSVSGSLFILNSFFPSRILLPPIHHPAFLSDSNCRVVVQPLLSHTTKPLIPDTPLGFRLLFSLTDNSSLQDIATEVMQLRKQNTTLVKDQNTPQTLEMTPIQQLMRQYPLTILLRHPTFLRSLDLLNVPPPYTLQTNHRAMELATVFTSHSETLQVPLISSSIIPPPPPLSLQIPPKQILRIPEAEQVKTWKEKGHCFPARMICNTILRARFPSLHTLRPSSLSFFVKYAQPHDIVPYLPGGLPTPSATLQTPLETAITSALQANKSSYSSRELDISNIHIQHRIASPSSSGKASFRDNILDNGCIQIESKIVDVPVQVFSFPSRQPSLILEVNNPFSLSSSSSSPLIDLSIISNDQANGAQSFTQQRNSKSSSTTFSYSSASTKSTQQNYWSSPKSSTTPSNVYKPSPASNSQSSSPPSPQYGLDPPQTSAPPQSSLLTPASLLYIFRYLLGSVCFYDWPHLKPARIYRIDIGGFTLVLDPLSLDEDEYERDICSLRIKQDDSLMEKLRQIPDNIEDKLFTTENTSEHNPSNTTNSSSADAAVSKDSKSYNIPIRDLDPRFPDSILSFLSRTQKERMLKRSILVHNNGSSSFVYNPKDPFSFQSEGSSNINFTPSSDARNEFKQKATSMKEQYLKRRGINVGNINVLCYVHPLTSLRVVEKSSSKCASKDGTPLTATKTTDITDTAMKEIESTHKQFSGEDDDDYYERILRETVSSRYLQHPEQPSQTTTAYTDSINRSVLGLCPITKSSTTNDISLLEQSRLDLRKSALERIAKQRELLLKKKEEAQQKYEQIIDGTYQKHSKNNLEDEYKVVADYEVGTPICVPLQLLSGLPPVNDSRFVDPSKDTVKPLDSLSASSSVSTEFKQRAQKKLETVQQNIDKALKRLEELENRINNPQLTSSSKTPLQDKEKLPEDESERENESENENDSEYSEDDLLDADESNES